MIRVGDLFDICYGHSLELNRLSICHDGINFVSRTAKNNGVSAKVKINSDDLPTEAGVITVALGGSVLETFLQPEPFYSGFHISILRPKSEMSDQIKLFYCACIKANKYRYNYGRQANRTLKDILVPSIEEIPSWVHSIDVNCFQDAEKPAIDASIALHISEWGTFKYKDLFFIERGRGPRKKELNGKGKYPFVSASEYNNGITGYSDLEPYHKPGVISVARNGASVASAFYQEVAFHSTEDVHIFTPRFKMTKAVALFFCALIKRERYRYSYGRKWGIGRMNETIIRLPVSTNDGRPNWQFMEDYVRSLKFSSIISE